MVSLTFSDVIADEGSSVGDGFCCGVLLLKAGVKVDTGSTTTILLGVHRRCSGGLWLVE